MCDTHCTLGIGHVVLWLSCLMLLNVPMSGAAATLWRLPPPALGVGGTQGTQMGVQVGEYCVLELTVIHNTSAQITKSPGICQREGGGAWGWSMGL